MKRAFKWASRRVNLTIQPPLSPGHLKEGRYLVLKVGVMDAEEGEDSKTPIITLKGWVEVKLCTNN